MKLLACSVAFLVLLAAPAQGATLAQRADAGDGRASLELANAAREAHQEASALRWYRRAGFLGNADGAYGKAYMVQYGEGTKPDPAYARELYARAANLGSAHAAYQLGYMAQMGVGGPRDRAEARVQYERAVGRGDAQAMFGLGTLLWLDTSDHAEGLKWFRRADAAATPVERLYIKEAYIYLGRATTSTSQAAAYFRKGTDLGEPLCCLELADATLKGRGVPRDEDAAEALYIKAEGLVPVDETDRLAPASAWLGQRALGRGDGEMARHWLELGADAGVLPAQRALVDLYAPGKPLANNAKAYMWASIAADAGDPMAWVVRWGMDRSFPEGDRTEGAALAKSWHVAHPRAIPSPGHKTP
ncbi:MAG: Sel1 domain protein repeat-containing protein [Cyanobacteria bacterium RYN_339]|nr:Sel1 domain protein repeat-containing protein [Cyanobacteria bacterium RYN_339]